MAGPRPWTQYLAGLPTDRRAGVETLRRTVNAAAPTPPRPSRIRCPRSTGTGRFLISYAAFKQHYSLFPASGAVMAALGDELTPYLAGRRPSASRPAVRSRPIS